MLTFSFSEANLPFPLDIHRCLDLKRIADSQNTIRQTWYNDTMLFPTDFDPGRAQRGLGEIKKWVTACTDYRLSNRIGKSILPLARKLDSHLHVQPEAYPVIQALQARGLSECADISKIHVLSEGTEIDFVSSDASNVVCVMRPQQLYKSLDSDAANLRGSVADTQKQVQIQCY